MTAPIRVSLVDDDPLVRAGLRMILSSAADIEVVGEAGDGAEAARLVLAQRPDVVLMDIRMPGTDGITATASIQRQPDPPKVIVLTTFHADEYVLNALRAGAVGFLLKDTAPSDIVRAVRLVHAGEAMLSPAVTHTLLGHVRHSDADDRRAAARTKLSGLTDREREVAIALGSGASNAEIAAMLFMSEATVKAHVSRVLTKLSATNRVQVAIAVHEAGLN